MSGWVGYCETQCRMDNSEWYLVMVAIASSNSFFPAIPVDKISGILVSAIAANKGKLVKSRLATFR